MKDSQKSQILKVFAHHRDEVRDCYGLGLKKNKQLEGEIVLQFKISSAGKAFDATVISTTVKNPRVENCILKKMLEWSFPPATDGEVTNVEAFPLVLKP